MGWLFLAVMTSLTYFTFNFSDVIKSISNETILLVFGDHGMTSTGDHGGDSLDEISSAFFAYSPSLNLTPSNQMHESISQVDLVPTISLLMGAPIPYSSLGKVVEDLFVNPTVENDHNLMAALKINLLQVERYIESYSDLGNEFPSSMYNELKLISRDLREKSDLNVRQKKTLILRYLTLAKLMCQEIWAKFNVPLMIGGIFLLLHWLCYVVVTLSNNLNDTDILKNILFNTLLFSIIGTAMMIIESYIDIDLVVLIHSLFAVLMLIMNKNIFTVDLTKEKLKKIMPLLITIFLCLGSFSNSYVVVENYVVSFIVLTYIAIKSGFILMPQILKKTLKNNSSKISKWNFKRSELVTIICMILAFVLIRMSNLFWKCREEQYWCETSLIHTTLSGLPKDSLNARYFTSLITLPCLLWSTTRWLTACGNLNGSRIGVLCANYVPFLFCILIAAHWALQANHNLQNIDIIVLPARLFYCLVILYFIILFIYPLLIYELPSSKNIVNVAGDHTIVIPQLFRNLKNKINESSNEFKTPVVYGLATSVSAPLLLLLLSTVFTIILVAGDGIAFSIVLLIATAFLSLIIHSIHMWSKAETVGKYLQLFIFL